MGGGVGGTYAKVLEKMNAQQEAMSKQLDEGLRERENQRVEIAQLRKIINKLVQGGGVMATQSGSGMILQSMSSSSPPYGSRRGGGVGGGGGGRGADFELSFDDETHDGDGVPLYEGTTADGVGEGGGGGGLVVAGSDGGKTGKRNLHQANSTLTNADLTGKPSEQDLLDMRLGPAGPNAPSTQTAQKSSMKKATDKSNKKGPASKKVVALPSINALEGGESTEL